ncbi:hypothetical protein WMY93_027637 [Mugilogobius chulae]|uniref:Tyrosine-protein kinase n=1 Tax=Mugilogobius chulae TaxID=88201 RepID=A0AAW0MTI6_9GOBI
MTEGETGGKERERHEGERQESERLEERLRRESQKEGERAKREREVSDRKKEGRGIEQRREKIERETGWTEMSEKDVRWGADRQRREGEKWREREKRKRVRREREEERMRREGDVRERERERRGGEKRDVSERRESDVRERGRRERGEKESEKESTHTQRFICHSLSGQRKRTAEESFYPTGEAVVVSRMDACGCVWYYGNINRVKAEKLLLASQNKEGSFLVRISESHSNEYTISGEGVPLPDPALGDRSVPGLREDLLATLGELISYYQKNPRSLGVQLQEPCVQQELFDMEPWERPREEFKLYKKLGEGHFGQVWEALWTTHNNKKVAIKTLKQEDTKQDEFVKEVTALKNLHHPKLIQLLAMCSRGEPVYIVTELMSKGSLKSYLDSPEGQVLTSAHLIYMGSQVAEGMAYLEDRSIVHRDLAARNILVGDDLVCKVADFGLARIIKDSVYTASRSTKIPVRWTAPEAALHQKFSVKSDVWSFGSCKSNKEVLDMLSQGYRLSCPTRCPPNIYRIMMDCWAFEPSKRPSFHALHSQLDSIYAKIYFKTIEV